MTKKSLKAIALPAALLLVGFVSCNRAPKSLAEMPDPTAGDSLMYYLGQMQADEFWRQTETDSTLAEASARAEFLKGVRAGMKAADGNDAYNRGLFLGVQLAMNSKEYKEAYEITLDEKLLLAGLEGGLESDTAVNIADAHAGFYKVVDRLNAVKEERDTSKARAALASAASKKGMKKEQEDLYAVDVTPARGVKLKEGDRVTLNITAATLSGHMAGGHFPNVTTLGEGRLPDVIRQAVYTMTPGQTRQFMTTPMAIFGRRYVRMNLSPDEPVIFTVNVDRAAAEPEV